MQNIRAQRGASLLNWLVILTLVTFFASAGFKLFPHYMDNYSLKKTILAVEQNKATGAEINTIADFYSYMERSLQVNGIRDLKLRESMKVSQINNDYVVHLNYEVREPLIKNIDMLVTFDQNYRVRAK